MSRYQNLSLLPNTRGFRFVGLTHAGVEVDCVVSKHPDGSHFVASCVAYGELRGWRSK